MDVGTKLHYYVLVPAEEEECHIFLARLLLFQHPEF
jgi:hypothetical protein